jgi:hypothetical protein
LCGAAFAADDLTPEKRAEIQRLITLTGGQVTASQVADVTTQRLAATLRKSKPDIPDRVFAAVNRELVTFFQPRVESPGGLADRLTALYHQNFTHAEITQLIAFYQTPFGRKTIDTLPKLTREAMSTGNAWARALGPEIRKRVEAVLKQEGIDMPRAK